MGYTEFKNGQAPYLSAETLNQMQVELMKMVFPIGMPYVTQTNTNPSTILGFGTWERLEGMLCVGLDENDEDFDEIGKVGGSKTHSLTKAELPAISFDTFRGTGTVGWGGVLGASNCDGVLATTQSIGGTSQAFSTMPPYKVVGYTWVRTA